MGKYPSVVASTYSQAQCDKWYLFTIPSPHFKWAGTHTRTKQKPNTLDRDAHAVNREPFPCDLASTHALHTIGTSSCAAVTAESGCLVHPAHQSTQHQKQHTSSSLHTASSRPSIQAPYSQTQPNKPNLKPALTYKLPHTSKCVCGPLQPPMAQQSSGATTQAMLVTRWRLCHTLNTPKVRAGWILPRHAAITTNTHTQPGKKLQQSLTGAEAHTGVRLYTPHRSQLPHDVVSACLYTAQWQSTIAVHDVQTHVMRVAPAATRCDTKLKRGRGCDVKPPAATAPKPHIAAREER